ncbi:MAG: AAA family ATPase [Actinobacteria bacterium]|nr:AAA family ATPase [Actinomycetota bacterium]
MYLKTLKIKGFKSFGKSVTLNFSRGLSVIVGPNGTGKSNIVDAILWVLGEQNPRFLRGQTMQDIIFSGSENLQPSPNAEVTLIFDNSDSSLPVDAPEVSIKRVVSRDGTSNYFINEKPCRLLDIRELLSHLNLGTELPGIVPQNRIYELINPHSSDLKAIIEESSGVSYYRMRRENAVRKLRSAEDKLEKIRLLQNEISLQLKPLKKQAEDYKRVVQLKSALEAQTVKKMLAELNENREVYEKINEEISALEGELDKLDSEIENLEEKRKLLEGALRKDSSAISHIEKVQKLKDFRSNFEFIRLLVEEKARNTLEKISNQRQLITSLNAEISNLQNKLKEIEKNLENQTSKMSDLEDERNLLLNDIALLEKDERSLIDKIRQLQGEIQNNRNFLTEMLRKIEVFDREVQSLSAEKQRLLKRGKKIDEDFKKMNLELSQKINESKELEIQEEKLKNSFNEAKKKLSLLKDEKVQLQGEYDSLKRSSKTLNEEIAKAEGAIKTFNADYSKVEDFIKLEENDIELLNNVLPHKQPLFVIFEEDLVAKKNFPAQFVLVNHNDLKEKIESLLKELKKQFSLLPKSFSKNYGFFYHPAGFYYQCSSEDGYYGLKIKLNELKRSAEETATKISEIEEKIRKKEKEEAVAENLLNSIEKDIEDIRKRLSRLRVDIKVIKEKQDFYLKEIKDIEERKQRLEANIEQSLERKKELSAKLDSLKENLTKLEREKNKYENELRILRSDILKKREKLKEIELHARHLKMDIEFSEKEASGLRKRLNESIVLQSTGSEGIKYFESRLTLLNRVHRLIEEYLETIKILLSANSYLSTYEEAIKKHTKEINELVELISKSYDRRSRLNSRLEILKSQSSERLKRIEELVRALEETTGKPIDRIIDTYTVEASALEYEKEIKKLTAKLQEIGEYNPFAIRDYEALKERLEKLKEQASDIRNAMKNINAIIEEVDRKILDSFRSSFVRLNENFSRIYSELTNGYSAYIKVDNENNISESSFNIHVSQPGKNLRSINLLSGGEKSLASLALILALEETFNIPFMVLDEVEPALDEVNLQRLISYLKKTASKTQIIMVTHQPLTVEAADVIYGVTVDKDGSSRIYSLKVDRLEVYDA